MASRGPHRRLRIALAQVNPVVGDVAANADLVRRGIARAREADAQLVVFPELVLTGYPPEDLLLKGYFIDAVERALSDLAAEARDIVALVGFAERGGGGLHNSAAVLADGARPGAYRKMLLPNYGVFDERRYFEPGEGPGLIELGGLAAVVGGGGEVDDQARARDRLR
jgi:NAD+ synthase (glutamine-hydrolysing)